MPDPSDADLIAFAARHYRQPGARDKAIRDEFGLTAVRYWQQVVAVMDSPERIAALPAKLWPIVRRLDEQRQHLGMQKSAPHRPVSGLAVRGAASGLGPT